jgi:peptidoglycan hydrolase-like protein with peptidoglycan-binding domain
MPSVAAALASALHSLFHSGASGGKPSAAHAGQDAAPSFVQKDSDNQFRGQEASQKGRTKQTKKQASLKKVKPQAREGGGSKTQGATAGAAAGQVRAPGGGKQGDVQLNVPWFSQFEAGNGYTPGSTACFNASVAMAKAGGATVLGPDQRIQIGQAEDSQGRLTQIDSKAAAQGRAYIDRELEAGRPVVAGVSWKDQAYNVDKLTDHFVTITGRGTDENGKTYYTYNEPGTRHKENSTGRLYVDEKSGNLVGDSKSGKHYEVSMVRKNAEDPTIPSADPAPARSRAGSGVSAKSEPAGGAASGVAAPSAGAQAGTASAVKRADISALADAVQRGQILRSGSSGPAVQQLQNALRGAGYDLKPDGKFGPQTEAALKKFQAANGLNADGLFGPKSLAALQGHDGGSGSAAPAGATAPGARPQAPARPQGPAAPKAGGAPQRVDPSATAKAGTTPDWRTAGDDIRGSLGIKGPSESLSKEQIDQALGMAAQKYGVSKELLKHAMKMESGGDQLKDNGAAHGLMQIERVHKVAYKGDVNVGNDTVANIAYAAKQWAEIGQKLDGAFKAQGLTPPTGATRDALMDFAYNRGPGVLGPIAKRAKEQGIDTNNLQEYFAGKGGKADWVKDKNGNFTMSITPGAGVDKHGQGSVLQEVVENDVRHITQDRRYKDRSGDGVRDHFDIWIQRSGKLLQMQSAAAA